MKNRKKRISFWAWFGWKERLHYLGLTTIKRSKRPKRKWMIAGQRRGSWMAVLREWIVDCCIGYWSEKRAATERGRTEIEGPLTRDKLRIKKKKWESCCEGDFGVADAKKKENGERSEVRAVAEQWGSMMGRQIWRPPPPFHLLTFLLISTIISLYLLLVGASHMRGN